MRGGMERCREGKARRYGVGREDEEGKAGGNELEEKIGREDWKRRLEEKIGREDNQTARFKAQNFKSIK